MSPKVQQYTEERVVIDGVAAVQRRLVAPPRKAQELYLYIPLRALDALAEADLPAAAWPLALRVIWHWTVTKTPASVGAEFASRARIEGRSSRRYAIQALETSRLFVAARSGKHAVNVSPSDALAKLLRTKDS